MHLSTVVSDVGGLRPVLVCFKSKILKSKLNSTIIILKERKKEEEMLAAINNTASFFFVFYHPQLLGILIFC